MRAEVWAALSAFTDRDEGDHVVHFREVRPGDPDPDAVKEFLAALGKEPLSVSGQYTLDEAERIDHAYRALIASMEETA